MIWVLVCCFLVFLVSLTLRKSGHLARSLGSKSYFYFSQFFHLYALFVVYRSVHTWFIPKKPTYMLVSSGTVTYICFYGVTQSFIDWKTNFFSFMSFVGGLAMFACIFLVWMRLKIIFLSVFVDLFHLFGENPMST